MKIWPWLVGGLVLLTLLVVANTRGANSVVTVVLPDNFHGVIRIPLKNSHRFWESNTMTCVVSENGDATEIIGPVWSIRRVVSASGKEIPIVYGRPEKDEYGFYNSDIGDDRYVYYIAGELKDYEDGFGEIHETVMRNKAAADAPP